jgi:hypothetical protein
MVKQLEARARSGRAGPRFWTLCCWVLCSWMLVPGPSFLSILLLGVLFLDPCSWILLFRRFLDVLFLDILFLDPRFWAFSAYFISGYLVPQFSFLGISWTFCSWVLVPGVIGRYATDSCLYWLLVVNCELRAASYLKYFKEILKI